MRQHKSAGFVLVAAAIVLSCRASAQAYPVLPLKVVNGAAQARVQEPVSFGIPVPNTPSLYDMGGLCVVDGALHRVPTQFKVLSRWGGVRTDGSKPIRWVLVSFLADAPASSTAIYQLAWNGGNVSQGLWAAQDMNTITVNTGPTTHFTIRRNQFTVIDDAVVNGVDIAQPGHLDMAMANGDLVTPQVVSTDLEEYAGWPSFRAVVKQRGILGQLKYTCRWYFYWGRSDVEVEFRLENYAAYGVIDANLADGQQYFDRLYLVQPINQGTGLSVTSEALTRTLPAGSIYDLRQSWQAANPLDLWAGFAYTEYLGGSSIGTGNRSAGAIDLSNSQSGLTVTVDRFWQQFPKAMRAQNGAIEVGLFPEWGNGPEFKGLYENPSSPVPADPMSLTNYRFEGGRWKTHRMVFDFHGGGPRTSAAVAAASVRVNAPLFGMADGSWIRRTAATGTAFMERHNWTDVSFQRYERLLDILVDDSRADVTNAERIGLPKFLRRGGTYGGNQTYGWDHYGDIWWADGFSAQHYDWTASMLYGFWRTGDYRYWDFGRDMVASRRDYNQNHSTDSREAWRGCQFYEKGWWHGNASTGHDTHNWCEGMCVHYAMTGHEGTREAIIENLGFILRFAAPRNWNGYWGSRGPGWSMDSLISAYNYLGDPYYLDQVRLGLQRYQQLEQSNGGGGYIINPANGLTASWGEAIAFIAGCKYTIASGDPTYLPLLGRMRDWYKNQITVLPTGTLTAMNLPRVHDQWAPTNPGTTSIHLSWPFVEAFAYSYLLTHDPTDMVYSQMFFDSLTRYWQAYTAAPPQNLLDPNGYSWITFRPFQYPATESKVLGNIMRWGNAYMASRLFYDGTW